MIAGLARKRGRIAALALLGALLGAFYLAIAQPIVTAYREAEAEIARSEMLLEGLRRAGSSRTPLEQHLDRLRAHAASQTAYLEAASDALAGADLQELVKRLVESNGGRLLSTVTLPAQEDPPFRKIAIQVRMEVDIAQAHQIFHALDTGSLMVFVDNLSIRGPRRHATADAAAAVPLDVRFDLYGYLRQEVS